ncbi:MAG: type II toxin-antitoxin system MqsA family antitoxin [Methyloglobulus sp.]|nr:type II toxin-antitoxin system MqsA family antitoxin [Methyloglobulus sp.]
MDIEKIAKAIEADAGMPLADVRQGLAEMQAMTGKVHTAEQLLVRAARLKTGLSQQLFAEAIKTPVATLQGWEQGRFTPPGGVLCLLKIIENHPELVSELAA